ncbi:MAG TPA: ribosome maturation factor RimP, partial [Bacillota bacterium]
KEIEGLAEVACRQVGLELADLEYVREGGRWYLRLYVDKPGGVTLDDCEAAHTAASETLDRSDPIGHAYTLEVASPGLERKLKREADFERFAGSRVEIRTHVAIDGSRRLHGRLVGLLRTPEGSSPDGRQVAEEAPAVRVTMDDGREISVPLAAIARARLAPDLPNGEKRGGARK